VAHRSIRTTGLVSAKDIAARAIISAFPSLSIHTSHSLYSTKPQLILNSPTVNVSHLTQTRRFFVVLFLYACILETGLIFILSSSTCRESSTGSSSGIGNSESSSIRSRSTSASSTDLTKTNESADVSITLPRQLYLKIIANYLKQKWLP
jgi:hypothetical protein